MFLRVDDTHKKVENEYESEYEDLVAGDRDAMDPYVYDLYQAVRYVEEFGGENVIIVITVSDSEVTGIASWISTDRSTFIRQNPLCHWFVGSPRDLLLPSSAELSCFQYLHLPKTFNFPASLVPIISPGRTTGGTGVDRQRRSTGTAGHVRM